jgi:hypothetical protein
MFPQRSQYFSSILRTCDVSDLAFIILIPLCKKKTCRRQEVKIAGVELRARITLVPVTGLDSFAMTCVFCIGSGAPMGAIAVTQRLSYLLPGSGKSVVVLTRKVTFFITRFKNSAVLYDHTKTAGKTYFPEKL